MDQIHNKCIVRESKKEGINMSGGSFDFNYWKKLAEEDEEEFERKRQEEIEKIIQSSRPESQGMLRDFQRRIDGVIWRERSLNGNMGVLYKLFDLCAQKRNELSNALTNLSGQLRRHKEISLSVLEAANAAKAKLERISKRHEPKTQRGELIDLASKRS